MTLETINGNLLEYQELEPDSFQHAGQITTERRDRLRLRNRAFYVADGNLYTIRKEGNLWAVTRLPQNLILSNIAEAYRQLTGKGTGKGNYFPSPKEAEWALNHKDTVIAEHVGLELKRVSEEYGYFVINPKNVQALNSQRLIIAQRIFGPDEENFGLNMEMFAKAGKIPFVYALMTSYVRRTLRESDEKFLMRASWLDNFKYHSSFNAVGRGGGSGALRGVRRVIAAGDAPKNEVPHAPQETGQKNSGVVTLERMLELSRNFVSVDSWSDWVQTLQKEYK